MISKTGYVMKNIGCKGNIKLVPVHRLIVEKYIKRFLTDEEVIHHINGIKTDNRIENLMIFKSQQAHARFHRQIKQFKMTQPRLTEIKNRWKEFKI